MTDKSIKEIDISQSKNISDHDLKIITMYLFTKYMVNMDHLKDKQHLREEDERKIENSKDINRKIVDIKILDIIPNNYYLLNKYGKRIKNIILNVISCKKYFHNLIDILFFEKDDILKICFCYYKEENEYELLIFKIKENKTIQAERFYVNKVYYLTEFNDDYIKFISEEGEDILTEGIIYLNNLNKNRNFKPDSFNKCFRLKNNDIIKVKNNDIYLKDKVIINFNNCEINDLLYSDNLNVIEFKNKKNNIFYVILDKWTYMNNIYFPIIIRKKVFDIICICYKKNININLILTILDKLFNYYEDKYIKYHN